MDRAVSDGGFSGKRVRWIVSVAAVAAVGISLSPALPQDPRYHQFADTQAFFGIPNFCNVVSNLPFLIVGLIGWRVALSGDGRLPALQTQYRLFFIGVFLTGLGSAYYHWRPDNDTLVWDRLPMTVAFAAFLAIVIGEHINVRASNRLVGPLVLAGIASVWYWHWTEAAGHGDLRFYAIIQFAPIPAIMLALLVLPSPFADTRCFWLLIFAYGAAKLLEHFDHGVSHLLGVVGGHPLKHLAAAFGAYQLCLALTRRRFRDGPAPSPY